MRALFVIILLTALSLPTAAFAEVQTFTTTHTYVLGDDDSRNSARQKCLAEAKRKILEQVGVYLESKSELITSSQSTTSGNAKSPQTTNEERQQITEQINTLAAGVMRSEVIKEEFGEVNGRYQMTLTLKVKVDPDDIQRQLAARQVDKTVRDIVAAQQERLKRLEAQLESMQRQQSGQSSEHATASPPIDISAKDLQTLHTQAAQGNEHAQYVLGVLYGDGNGVPQDYGKAHQWYEKAAFQGHAKAESNLGSLYYEGQGVPQDYAKARQWWEQAAAQGSGSDRAQYNIGVLYYNGQGVPKDYAKARQWYEQAAAQGYGDAQYNLGALYAYGYGVPQDYGKAQQWYEKAAAQGHAAAQHSLGLLYAEGKEGVQRDYAKAREWYEKAAAQGDASAQIKLGILYNLGQGVPQDYAKARQWYGQAVAQGHPPAQFLLGFLYASGQGVPQDYVRAYMWFNLAAAHLTGDEQKLAADQRNKTSQMMTPAQIAEAQRLSQQCQSRQFKGC